MPLLRIYRAVHRLSYGLRQRLTPLGGWLLGGLTAAGTFGIDTRTALVHQLFVLLAAAFVIASLASRFGRLPVTATRCLPRYATVGRPLRYRLRLHNHSAAVQRALTVREELREWAPGVPSTPIRGLLTYRRWRWLTTQARGANSSEQSLPLLPPETVTEAELSLTPLRRGWLDLAALRFGRPDPLGLIKRIFRQPLAERLLVLPQCYPIPPLRLQEGRRYQRGGIHLAQSVSEENEFSSLRDYRPGDPPRRIHWRSFAKRGEPIVKECQDEFFIRYGLVLDNYADKVDAARFEAAVSAAASIAAAKRGPETLLDLLFVDNQAYCVTAGRGLGQTEQLLEVLACLTPNHAASLTKLSALLASHVSSLSACVCVLLDWDEERLRLVRLLRGHGVETITLVIGPPSARPELGVQVATVETLAADLANLTARFS